MPRTTTKTRAELAEQLRARAYELRGYEKAMRMEESVALGHGFVRRMIEDLLEATHTLERELERPHINRLVPTKEMTNRPRTRRWVGRTDDGLLVDLFVAAVRVADIDRARFESRFRDELEELPLPPDPAFRALRPKEERDV